MNCGAKSQLESGARYGRALGHAAANVVHEVNAPLSVALARVQLALRLLDELPTDQAAALDEQLRGCEAAIRSSAKVVRELNYLRHDLMNANDGTSGHRLLIAAYQFALLDASQADCELDLRLPSEDVSIPVHPQDMLVLLLELIWDRLSQGAKKLCLELDLGVEPEEPLVRIMVASDLKRPCDDSTRAWLDYLALVSGACIHWQLDDCRGGAYVVMSSHYNQ
jgi:signal transduction histidine kinase